MVFQAGISSRAYISPLHEKMLKQHYFPVIGSVPKHFIGRNRRHLDITVARFEEDTQQEVSRSAWGLPTPNLEASYLSLAKYAKDVEPLSPILVSSLNTAARWMERHFAPYMANSRVKSVEEVMAGLDLSTSPGWPWVLKYKTKRDMLKEWPECAAYMAEDWERLKDPKANWTAVFGNSLKEEIRPAEKIATNSIRTFTAGPIEATIHGNRLFEDMNEKFYESHLRTSSVVGFSPLKGGWNELYKKLQKFRRGFALDESQYDSSLRAYLMWYCAQFRWNMLREEDRTKENLERIRNYYRNLINTLIITSEGVFVLKLGGNPSGSVNTITDNTLILYLLLAFAWIQNAPAEKCSYEQFEDLTSKCLCGDDNTFTVAEEAIEFFNAENIIPTWAEIGITTTTDSMQPRDVEELDFLSAHTTFVDGIAVPLYDRTKLLTSLLYTRYRDDPAYTLVRATALQRVAWADAPMRNYLREFVSWLVDEFDNVLHDDPNWAMARDQIPLDHELKALFLGKDLFVMTPQSCGKLERCNSHIKISKLHRMSGALPQRSRRNRRQQQKKGPRRQVGPRGQNGAFLSKNMAGNRRQRRRRAPRQKNFTGTIPRGPSGLRRGKKRHNFSEDEFIIDVLGNTTFGSGTTNQAIQFAINPGQAASFPWLAPLAQRYEKYVFTRLDFHYKHEVSEFATAGTVGKAILAFDYDAADAPPTTKTQMLDMDPHKDAMPCQDFMLRVDCREAFNNGPKYVRSGNLPGGADIKTYDCGLLNFAASGTADATTKIGELHVSYAGWFEKPVLDSSTSAPANFSFSALRDASPVVQASGVTATLPLATVDANGLNLVNAAGQFTLPAGNYRFSIQAQLTAATNMTLWMVTLEKNTVAVPLSGVLAGTVAAAAVVNNIGGSAQYFVQSNGSDVFRLRVNMTGTGALTCSAQLLVSSD